MPGKANVPREATVHDPQLNPSAAMEVHALRRLFSVNTLLSAPVLLLLGAVFVYPTTIFLLRAFTHFDAPQIDGLDNLIWFLADSTNQIILVRTFGVAALCAVLTAVIAFPYAYLMLVSGPTGRTVLLGALLLSMLFGILLRNFAWVITLQYQGPLNDLLEFLGLERIRFLGKSGTVLMGMMHVLFPFMVLPLYSVLRGIDMRLMLAARSLGATPTRAFFQVYLPLAMPGVLGGAILVFVLALGFFVTPALLGSPRQSLMSQLMYSQFERQAAFGRAGAMALILLTVAMVFVAFANFFQRKGRAYGEAR
jgi:putative spermidine/putrescine transport system permease protein